MGYKVKRGTTSTDNTIKEMLVSFFKRLVALLIILTRNGWYWVIFFFDFSMINFPVFAIAADDVIAFIKGFYAEHGIWATLGFIGFICLAVWALGEEAKRKERTKRYDETNDEIRKEGKECKSAHIRKQYFERKFLKALFWTGFVLVFFLSVVAIVRVSNVGTDQAEAKQSSTRRKES